MGFFGTYLFDGRQWWEHDPEEEPSIAEPWLLVDIHDSDIATVRFAPSGRGSGIAYLGFTPRTYFADDSASESIDVAREAEGLAEWWGQLHVNADEVAKAAKARQVIGFLACDDDSGERDDQRSETDDADIFVEVKTARFLRALGLSLPEGLPG
jgi:hypothetical protein